MKEIMWLARTLPFLSADVSLCVVGEGRGGVVYCVWVCGWRKGGGGKDIQRCARGTSVLQTEGCGRIQTLNAFEREGGRHNVDLVSAAFFWLESPHANAPTMHLLLMLLLLLWLHHHRQSQRCS